MEWQCLEMFDMPVGAAWFEGLNKNYAPADLEKLVGQLCSKEMMEGKVSCPVLFMCTQLFNKKEATTCR